MHPNHVADPSLRGYAGLAASFADGTDSPRAFLERCLEVITERDPELRCFVTTAITRARMAADAATARWKAARQLSAIDGLPIGVKDIIDVADMPTAMGSPTAEHYRPLCDAAAVYALREAGAVIVGKTKTTEFASTYPTDTRNPRDPTRTPGGSSSGSAAAVGAGMLPAALGTQVVGSVLRPASFCGAYGYKPTYGAINRGGSHENTQSHSTIGVIGASLEDTWNSAYAMASRAGGDPGQQGLTGSAGLGPARRPATVALLETAGWAAVTDAARRQLDAFLSACGSARVTVVTRHTSTNVERLETALADVLPMTTSLLSFEQRWPLKALAHRDPDGLSEDIKARIRHADEIGLDGYRRLLERRAQVRTVFREVMATEDIDAVVSLSAPGAAPVGLFWTGDPTLTVSASVLGVPALSLPVFEDDGMPLGLQLIGVEGDDHRLFSFAQWCETHATGVRGR
jgi:Asp-tRNA(Asn)/Glu-tRNA(Gln) amidotransferase A subunit family amidase